MFFGKKEPRYPSPMTVLVVGGLALVGVFAIATRGRELYETASQKMKMLVNKAENCMCDTPSSSGTTDMCECVDTSNAHNTNTNSNTTSYPFDSDI